MAVIPGFCVRAVRSRHEHEDVHDVVLRDYFTVSFMFSYDMFSFLQINVQTFPFLCVLGLVEVKPLRPYWTIARLGNMGVGTAGTLWVQGC